MSEKYELTGTIKQISDTQHFPSGFSKRQFVVTTDDAKYPQDIALEFVKDGCARLDAYQQGDGCKVQFNIRGNEYNGNHYVQLAAWKIERTDDGLGIRSPEYGKPDAQPPTAGGHSDHDEEEDDIPF